MAGSATLTSRTLGRRGKVKDVEMSGESTVLGRRAGPATMTSRAERKAEYSV